MNKSFDSVIGFFSQDHRVQMIYYSVNCRRKIKTNREVALYAEIYVQKIFCPSRKALL